jgi:hypothetical protein
VGVWGLGVGVWALGGGGGGGETVALKQGHSEQPP